MVAIIASALKFLVALIYLIVINLLMHSSDSPIQGMFKVVSVCYFLRIYHLINHSVNHPAFSIRKVFINNQSSTVSGTLFLCR